MVMARGATIRPSMMRTVAQSRMRVTPRGGQTRTVSRATGHRMGRSGRQALPSFAGLTSGTITTNGAASSFLFAADFRNGKIDVLDANFNPVSPDSPSSPLAANAFQDAKVPPDFSPYNIRQLGGTIFVTYAKEGPDGNPVLGAGQGFVDAFSTTGQLLAASEVRGTSTPPSGWRWCRPAGPASPSPGSPGTCWSPTPAPAPSLPSTPAPAISTAC
jgi:hypothetical protein